MSLSPSTRLSKILKTTATKRVKDLEEWHQNSLDIFARHLSEHDRSIIAKCFQNGLMLMSGAIPSAGGIISMTIQDAMFVAEVMNILQKTPKVPHSKMLSRYVYIPDAKSIISANPANVKFPPVPNTIIPHLLPFASTLREGFAMYWTNRTDAIKQIENSPCCVLRIRVPRNTNAFFWGPTPMAAPESILRMDRGLFPKKLSQFEVLLPPANLKVVKVTQKNLCKTLDLIPEYQNNVMKLESVAEAWCNVPVYECEMEPLKQNFLVCKDLKTAAFIAGVSEKDEKLKGTIFLIAESLLHKDVQDRLNKSINNGTVRLVSVINDRKEEINPSTMIFEDNIDYNCIQKHIERVIQVMEVFNKYNPKNIKPYPIQNALLGLSQKNSTILRRIIGGFWSDLTTSYEGFIGYLIKTSSEDLIIDVLERIKELLNEDLEDMDMDDFEGNMSVLLNILDNNVMLNHYMITLSNLSEYNTWQEFLESNPKTVNKLKQIIKDITKYVKAFEKDLKVAKRYLNMEKLTEFRYTLKVKLVTQACDLVDDKTTDRLKEKKLDFINQMKNIFKPYTDNNNVVGVSFVPIHNGNIILGKEKAGVYKNKYNYFGGKIQDKIQDNHKATAEDVADVLFEEAFEEMGIALEGDLIQKSLVQIIVAPYKTSVSLIILCNMEGVNKSWWDSIAINREHETIAWKYREMSKIDSFKISAIQSGHFDRNISVYVKDTIQLIADMMSTVDSKPSVNIRKFGTIKISSKGHAKFVSP